MISTTLAFLLATQAQPIVSERFQVGGESPEGLLVTTGARVKPYGRPTVLAQRPVQMVVGSPTRVWLKHNAGVALVDPSVGKVVANFPATGGASLTGLERAQDGKTLVYSNAQSGILIGDIVGDSLTWREPLEAPRPRIGGSAYPCGLAEVGNGDWVVALSRSNQVGFFSIDPPAFKATLDVDLAPFDVAVVGNTALVTCWSRKSKAGEPTATSAGTRVPTLPGGGGVGGTLTFVDIPSRKVITSIPLGLQPTEIAVAPDGLAYIGNANSDTVSVVNIAQRRVVRTIRISLSERNWFGKAPNGVALTGDAKHLLVPCGGLNAVLVYRRTANAERLVGAVRTGWYPAGAAMVGNDFVSISSKGIGSRGDLGENRGRNVYQFTGLLNSGRFPSEAELREGLRLVRNTSKIARADASVASAPKNVPPVPVPAALGQPSVFEHVVYIIKENRTYDQVLGELKGADGEPSLCMFSEEVVPNHRALAQEFVVLDNYYCNGVLSADGHAWATESNATTYFERAFGGWTRSYPFGDDPLAVSQTGYVWDDILAAGKTFRNYGEFDYAEPIPRNATFKQIYDDFVSGQRKIKFTQNIGVARLRKYSDPQTPGWNMRIPDILRAHEFLKDFAEWNRAGKGFPNFTIIYLPQDHLSGTVPGMPTPRAHMADNDLALGRIVDALSKSKFWPKTVIFANEDDPQDGFDHVDGHRSLCFVISPYTRRGAVVSDFYNQSSVIATMRRILGVKPMNLFDARSPLMTKCFQNKRDLRPYHVKQVRVPLDELNPPRPRERSDDDFFAAMSEKLYFAKPDRIGNDLYNRVLWHATKPGKPYPEALVGAHGTGLAKRGLRLENGVRPD